MPNAAHLRVLHPRSACCVALREPLVFEAAGGVDGGIEERGEEGCEREGEAGGEQGGDSGPPQASSGEDDAGESLPTSLKELLAARCAGRPRRRLRPG